MKNRNLLTAGLLAIGLIGTGATGSAVAYDPCVRATQERNEARARLYSYYDTHCTWSYNPDHCRNPPLGHRLEREYIAANQKMRAACRY